jgi:hypothetical protein
MRTYPDQSYPTLGEYTCRRRTFLRQVLLGAAAVGAGRILSACTSTTGLTGTIADRPLHEVRLPGSGLGGAYLRHDEYLTFVVTFDTYSDVLATHYRSEEADGLWVVSSTLSTHGCEDLRDDTILEAARQALVLALETRFAEVSGLSGHAIRSLAIEIDDCATIPMPDGGRPAPFYP